jgi:hypothetical protein
VNRATLLLVALAFPALARAQLAPCATPVGPDLPDLIVHRRALRADKMLADEFVETNSCELIEGCAGAAGQRRLLRFTTVTPNIGATALVIGEPSQCGLLFHLSECHGHYHFEQFAAYRLWTRAGYRTWKKQRSRDEPASSEHNAALLEALEQAGELMAGRKQGFCLVDDAPFPPGQKPVTPREFFNCATNQGISVGWADVYLASIDCQFVDVTGAPPGRRVLEVEVNPDRVLPESNYRNNSATARIRIP